jgi:pyruvate dehydrogenase E1 component alpha subunit
MTSLAASNASGKLTSKLPDETLKGWLRDMLLIREFEIRTMQAYSNALIGGFCHVYTGQEPVAVGTIAAVEPDDPVITAYRDHGHALARGMDPRFVMAEMFGKAAGCAKGKGGSMHMFDKPNLLYGGHGIVGAQTPLGAGLAFAVNYEREVLQTTDKKRVALCYLGDGALNQGAFHESMNLAGLFDLPVIYIVENNRYSMGTSIERGTTMADDLVKKAEGYGMEGVEIDGLDILNIYDEFKPLVDRCRENSRPAFVDLKTYRYHGHSMSDPQKYRSKDEVSEFQDKDGIDRLAKHLMDERGAITEDDYKQMNKEIRKVVRDAVKFAEDAEEPDLSELTSDVYQNIEPNLSPTTYYTEGAPNQLLEEES